jgi:hypothetical protein
MVAYVVWFLNACILGFACVCVHFSLSLFCVLQTQTWSWSHLYSNSASVWPPWISWYAAPDPSYVHSFYACTARAPSQQKVLPQMVAYVVWFLNACILGLASVCVHFSLSLMHKSGLPLSRPTRSISSAVLLAYDQLAQDIRHLLLLTISTIRSIRNIPPNHPHTHHPSSRSILWEYRLGAWFSLTYAVLASIFALLDCVQRGYLRHDLLLIFSSESPLHHKSTHSDYGRALAPRHSNMSFRRPESS